jgi:hypothetical protein
VPCRGRAIGELLTKRVSIQVARILDKACAAANKNPIANGANSTANPSQSLFFLGTLQALTRDRRGPALSVDEGATLLQATGTCCVSFGVKPRAILHNEVLGRPA